MEKSRISPGSANSTFTPRTLRLPFANQWGRGDGMSTSAIAVGLALVLSFAATAQQKTSPDAILRHAVELHQTGDMPGAISEYRAYLKHAPQSVMARSNLGAALAKSGQYED